MSISSYTTNHSVLKRIKDTDIEVLSFFKGLKLQSKEEIVKINNNVLIIKVSNKQKLNLLCDKRYYLIVDNERYVVENTIYLNAKGYLIFDNISQTPYKELNRDEVRLLLEDKKAFFSNLDKSFFIHDISEKSLSILVNDTIDDNLIVTINDLVLSFIQTNIEIKFLKKEKLNIQYKYIFLITKRNENLIQFIHKRQRDILKKYSPQLNKL